MDALEWFGLRGVTNEDRAYLRERRAEFWAWVGRVAVGVFVGMCAFALVALIVFRLWLDSEL